MRIRQLPMSRVVLFGFLSSMILGAFALARLQFFPKETQLGLHAYTFGAYFDTLMERFDLVHFSLLLVPFLCWTFLTTEYLDTYILQLRYISISRYQNIKRWLFLHIISLAVCSLVYLLVIHGTLLALEVWLHSGSQIESWRVLLVLIGKQLMVTGTISLIQFYVSLAVTLHAGTIAAWIVYMFLLLCDFSRIAPWRWMTLDHGMSGFLCTVLPFILLLLLISLQSQKKLLHIVCS